MRKLSDALYFVALTAWIGGMWVIGYLAVPALFANLADRQLAGMLAGKMFALDGWVGLACAAYLAIFLAARWRWAVLKRSVFWLVLAMALLTAVSLFGIQPLMAQLKVEAWPREVMESVLKERFVAWHGVSSVLYLVQSLLGLWLVIWTNRGLK